MKDMPVLARVGRRFFRARGYLICAIAMSLVSCDSRKDAAESAQKGQAAVSSKPKATNGPSEVKIGYFANLTHAQAVLGIASGDFEKAIAPAKLTTRVFNAGPSLVEALFAGEIDMGYVGPGPALSAFEKSKGEGILVLAGAAANGVVIVASKDSGIKTLADLAGKKIATPQMGNTQDIAARHYVTSVLKQPNADNVVPVPNAEQSAMMSRGQIDAAWAPEPWGARLIAETGAVLVGEEKDLWPDKEFVLTLVVVRPEFLEKHPDVVARVLGVHEKWTHALQADAAGQVDALGAALLQLTGKKLDSGVLRDAITRIKFTDEPSEKTLGIMADWALGLGFAKSKPDLAKMINRTLLEQARAASAGSHP